MEIKTEVLSLQVDATNQANLTSTLADFEGLAFRNLFDISVVFFMIL